MIAPSLIPRCYSPKWLVILLFALVVGCGDGSDELYKFAAEGGRSIGMFKRTFYVLSYEKDYEGNPASAPGGNGQSLGNHPFEFLDDICLQGSGMLPSGETISINWSGCSGSTFNSSWCKSRCFALLDPVKYPFGPGSGGSPRPYRGVAVDTGVISMHTKLYLPRWDGFTLPNGTVHDGCFEAKDTGGGIKGKHIDVHAGVGRRVYQQVAGMIGGGEEEIFTGVAKCDRELEEVMPKSYFLQAYEPGGNPPPAAQQPQNEPEEQVPTTPVAQQPQIINHPPLNTVIPLPPTLEEQPQSLTNSESSSAASNEPAPSISGDEEEAIFEGEEPVAAAAPGGCGLIEKRNVAIPSMNAFVWVLFAVLLWRRAIQKSKVA